MGAVNGSWSLQAEWTGTNIVQIKGPRVFLQGFYVSASYFLTGEHREYAKDGYFGMTQVRGPVLGRREQHFLAHGPGTGK